MSAPEGRSVNAGVSEHWTCGGKGRSSHNNILWKRRSARESGCEERIQEHTCTMAHGKALGRDLFTLPEISPQDIHRAVEWVSRQEGVKNIIHYLDDFLIVAAPDTDEGSATLKTDIRSSRPPGGSE